MTPGKAFSFLPDYHTSQECDQLFITSNLSDEILSETDPHPYYIASLNEKEEVFLLTSAPLFIHFRPKAMSATIYCTQDLTDGCVSHAQHKVKDCAYHLLVLVDSLLITFSIIQKTITINLAV